MFGYGEIGDHMLGSAEEYSPSTYPLTLLDTITYTETVSRAFSRRFTDTQIISEFFLIGYLRVKSFIDAVILTDSIKLYLNGARIRWQRIIKAVGSIWTKIAKTTIQSSGE